VEYKSEILAILQRSGEPLPEQDTFSFSRLGEGMGYASYLWTVRIGERMYAVKITDPVQKVGEIRTDLTEEHR
ncbi:hypothetical protein PENTCL1PPCAC_16367, partial [Pristionchus entomophagus]